MPKLNPPQGVVGNPRALGPAKRVPEPDTRKLMNADQRAINAKDASLTRPRPPQKLSGKQDWRKG